MHRSTARGDRVDPVTFSLSHSLTLSLSKVWSGWKRFARRLADFQGRVLLTLLYVVLIVPGGLVLRLIADPLGRRRPRTSNWRPRPPVPATLDEARRQ
jgi:hypothetical protein